MTGFIIVAALLALLTVLALTWPLLDRRGRQPREVLAALAVAALIVGGGAGLYAVWSKWSWSAPQSDGTPQSMVASLARRLDSHPDDLDGWLMLGRSYAALEQFPLSARAYQRADRLAGGRNAAALEGWAEALVMNNEEELAGRAGRLFEQALAIAPDSGKALFYSAIAAQRRGELSLAKQRFALLLTRDPPPNVRPLLEQQIAALDLELRNAAAPAAADKNARVVVKLSLAPALAARLRSDAPLFVLARTPGQPGPPLAVKRLTAQFPLQVELTAADAMMPGHSIVTGQNVEVVARVALGGNPTGSPGDLFGLLRYDVGKDGPRSLVIDQVAQ